MKLEIFLNQYKTALGISLSISSKCSITVTILTFFILYQAIFFSLWFFNHIFFTYIFSDFIFLFVSMLRYLFLRCIFCLYLGFISTFFLNPASRNFYGNFHSCSWSHTIVLFQIIAVMIIYPRETYCLVIGCLQ